MNKIKIKPLSYHINKYFPYRIIRIFKYDYILYYQRFLNTIKKYVSNKYLNLSLKSIVKSELTTNIDINNFILLVLNYKFLFNSLIIDKKKPISIFTKKRIVNNFLSLNNFRDQFIKKGLESLGTSWVWVVETTRRIHIISSTNMSSPIIIKSKPILVFNLSNNLYFRYCSYSLIKYIKIFYILINWNFAELNIKKNYILRR